MLRIGSLSVLQQKIITLRKEVEKLKAEGKLKDAYYTDELLESLGYYEGEIHAILGAEKKEEDYSAVFDEYDCTIHCPFQYDINGKIEECDCDESQRSDCLMDI